MANKIKKMMNNGTAYTVGGVESSNDTYENIIHLSQAEYDALENPDPDTMYSTPDSESPGVFNPENEGETGQVLKKTSTGYRWDTVIEQYEKYIDLLVVGGGGSGGAGCDQYPGKGGGGGGGGVKECIHFGITGNSATITIGGGGPSPYDAAGCNGGNSSFNDGHNNIIALGGGGGGAHCTFGKDGGNGGGGGGSNGQSGAGLDGGYFGGLWGGGGGGAGGPGDSGTCDFVGFGGPGYRSEIFCTGYLFGTGGSGGKTNTAHCGGGVGCGYSGTFYGGGGGGACSGCHNGGSGCKGVVMLRYPTDGSYGITCSTGGNKCFTCDGYCYVEFTGNGTFNIVS